MEQLVDIEKQEGSVGEHFWKQFSRVCTSLPAKSNFYLSWWLRGLRAFSPESNPTLAPPFLTKRGFDHLKVNLFHRMFSFCSSVRVCMVCGILWHLCVTGKLSRKICSCRSSTLDFILQGLVDRIEVFTGFLQSYLAQSDSTLKFNKVCKTSHI